MKKFKLENICRGQLKCVSLIVQFFFDRTNNILEKGENAGKQNILLSSQCIKKASFEGS